jgi:hypothetical protein
MRTSLTALRYRNHLRIRILLAFIFITTLLGKDLSPGPGFARGYGGCFSPGSPAAGQVAIWES